jgi:hypothetical protein
MADYLVDKIKRNTYLLFLFKMVALFAIVFTLDYSIGNILSFFYFKQDSGMQYRTTYSLEKITADIIILGSSRANHNYRPDIFEKRLNLSVYNAGRDGNYIFYHYAILTGVLKRYTPKIIILDFDPGEFSKTQLSYDRISSLLPYYERHPEIRAIIELKSPYERIKLLSSIYPYNSSIFSIAIGNTELNKKRWLDIKGYLPLTKTWNGSIQIDSSSIDHALDSTKVKVYESFIQDCLISKVKLYIVCSPCFIKSNQTDYSVTLGRDIAKRNYVKFFDFSKDSVLINNPKLFADILHLNDEGAKVFSNILLDSIGKTIGTYTKNKTNLEKN